MPTIETGSLSPEEVRQLCKRAEIYASGVVRSLRLSHDDWFDLHQDIALYVLLRVRHFDAERGSFAAFVELVARQAAGRFWRRAVRTRQTAVLVYSQAFDPVGCCWDALGSEGVDDPGFEEVALRHDLERMLSNAPPRIVGTFTVIEAAIDHPVSRTSWYRRRVELRRWLLAHGLAPPE